MDNLPKELEETQLTMQVVIDPDTKCLTLRTHTEEIDTNTSDSLPRNAIPNDPLQNPQAVEPDLEKMTELERLIYEERARLLNIKIPKRLEPGKERQPKRRSFLSNTALTNRERTKLGMRKLREQETPEETDARRFRHRIFTLKRRLIQQLQNFDDDTFLKELKKRNADRIKQKRMEIKAKETPEEMAQRKSEINRKSRIAHKRVRAFRTPEELKADREKRVAYLEKFWSKHTEEERQAQLRESRAKAKERRHKKIEEWKKVNMIAKGVVAEKEAVTSVGEKIALL